MHAACTACFKKKKKCHGQNYTLELIMNFSVIALLRCMNLNSLHNEYERLWLSVYELGFCVTLLLQFSIYILKIIFIAM